jgi:hypothetical protein
MFLKGHFDAFHNLPLSNLLSHRHRMRKTGVKEHMFYCSFSSSNALIAYKIICSNIIYFFLF